VADALRQRIDQERAPDDLLPDVWLTELSRLLPDLRDRYPDLPPPLTDEATAPMRLYEAVVRLTAALAQRRPLVWVVDDMRWTDACSRDLLHYAARRWVASGVPVLLLFRCALRHRTRQHAANGNCQLAGPAGTRAACDLLRPEGADARAATRGACGYGGVARKRACVACGGP